MITEIKNKSQIKAFEAAIEIANTAAAELIDIEDTGTPNNDCCLVRLKFYRGLRQATTLHLVKGWGQFKDYWRVEELVTIGRGSLRSAVVQEQCRQLRAAGYDAIYFNSLT